MILSNTLWRLATPKCLQRQISGDKSLCPTQVQQALFRANTHIPTKLHNITVAFLVNCIFLNKWFHMNKNFCFTGLWLCACGTCLSIHNSQWWEGETLTWRCLNRQDTEIIDRKEVNAQSLRIPHTDWLHEQCASKFWFVWIADILMPFQPKNNESLLFNFLWGCIHHIRGLVRASRQSSTKHLMKNYSQLSVYFVHCHRGDLCKAMTTMVSNRALPSCSCCGCEYTTVRSGVFPSKLSSGLFQSTGAILRVHHRGFSVVFELLSGLSQLREISFKAEICTCEWPKRRRKQKYMGRLTPTIQVHLE